ncbi:MAG: M20 metallopeptidase family protein [Bacteroidia bacterium]
MWNQAQQLLPEVITIRRHLHQHPEPSFQEFHTQKYLQEVLTRIGLESTPIGGTGLMGHWGPLEHYVALRADLDALPIDEQRITPYRSQNPGYMHACGHDAHAAMLVGALMLLQKYPPKGGVRYLFQPGEEKAPGGASLLIQEGALEPPPRLIVGQHVTPWLPTGTIGYRAGPFMASSDEIHLTLRGVGGHAAQPHLTHDPLTAGAYLITHLQTLISRRSDPRLPSVLSFGEFKALGAVNVIPQEASLKGTFRTFDETWRHKAHQEIHHLTTHIAQAHHVQADLHIQPGYPVLHNNPHWTLFLVQKFQAYGIAHLQEVPLLTSSEDFAFYTQKVPGVFFRLGTGNPSLQTEFPVHSPLFDIDENAMAWGMTLLAMAAHVTLNENT